jgi:hypothetical protein
VKNKYSRREALKLGVGTAALGVAGSAMAAAVTDKHATRRGYNACRRSASLINMAKHWKRRPDVLGASRPNAGADGGPERKWARSIFLSEQLHVDASGFLTAPFLY